MFEKLGRFVYRHRRPAIALWLAVLAFALIFAPRVTSALKAGGFSEEASESAQTQKLLERELGFRPAAATVVFSHPDLTVDDPRYLAEMRAALADLRLLPQVVKVVSYADSPRPGLVSPDRHTTYAEVYLSLPADAALDLVPQMRALLRPSLEGLRPGELNMWLTGVAPIYADIVDASEQDLRRAETFTLPLALVALLLIFGSLIAAGAPLVIGGISVAATLALLYFIAQAMDISIFVLNLATMLGLGIAIDYSLLMVSRFREELEAGSVEGAVITTVATAGKAIFFSGAATFVGLMGLMVFKFAALRSLGLGGALVVLVSVLAALTLLPALLGVLGPRVNALRPSLEGLRLWPRFRGFRGGLWHGLASWVMRHPLPVFGATVALLLTLGTPFLGVELGMSGAQSLPPSAGSRQGLDILDREFGEGDTILVAVTAPQGILHPQSVGALYDFTHQVARDPRVLRVDSIVDVDPRIPKAMYQGWYADPQDIPYPELRQALEEFTSPSTTLVQVVSRYPANSPESRGLAKDIRAMELGAGLQARVGGLAAELDDSISILYRDFPIALALVVAVIYVALVVLFRSLVLPLKAVVMNALSILASYGALVFIFQQGHLSGLLNFTPQGVVEHDLPVLIFFILYGLSMDYEVFLLTRIKEVYDRTGDNTQSVALGLEKTGRIITSAALIMVLVTGSFVSADILYIKALGLGIAIAIFLDATVVRALLVPATMRLLGRWNWWAPRFIKGGLP